MTVIKDRDKHYKRQKRVQLIIYLLEVLSVISVILSIYSKLEKGSAFAWFKDVGTFDFLDKVTIIFALHQLLIFAYVRLKLSARDDAILTISTLISHALNMCKYGVSPEKVLERCDELKESKKGKTYMLNSKDIEIIDYIKHQTELLMGQAISIKEYEYKLESLRIDLNHEAQSNNLAWTNSFFLNLFK
ncbi:MAG TPA: hypothetical protein VEY68_15115 [Anoxybacillus sp.]|nr:hypothetical protein [Anoxybacillus sp.]